MDAIKPGGKRLRVVVVVRFVVGKPVFGLVAFSVVPSTGGSFWARALTFTCLSAPASALGRQTSQLFMSSLGKLGFDTVLVDGELLVSGFVAEMFGTVADRASVIVEGVADCLGVVEESLDALDLAV